MPLFFFLAFLMLPAIEIASIIAASLWIGVIPTLLLLCAGTMLGLLLIRSQTLFLRERILRAMEQGNPPEKALLDSAMISFAGVLFIIPGFVTDALAGLTLLPFARRFIWRMAASAFRRRNQGFRLKPRHGTAEPGRKEDVIDVEFTEVPPSGRKAAGRESPWKRPKW
jgi:UPF0716 protein FxsA